MRSKLKWCLSLWLLCNQLLAQQFQYECELEQPKNTWHSIVLPPSVLEKVKPNFSDLRVLGIKPSGDTIQAPYILEWNRDRVEKVEIAQKLINQVKGNGVFLATLEMKKELVYNQLNLQFGAKNYDFFIQLEGSNENANWKTIGDNFRVVGVHEKGRSFTSNRLHFKPCNYRYLRMSMLTKENPELQSAKLMAVEEQKGVRELAESQFKVLKNGTTTHVEIDLKHRLPVEFIELDIASETDYFRPIKVATATQYDIAKTDTIWRYQTVFSGDIHSFQKHEVKWQNHWAKRVKVSIENGDNQPLNVRNVQLYYPSVFLKARFTDAAHYKLLYGDEGLSFPNYDILKFQNQIPDSLESLKLFKCKELKEKQTEVQETDPTEYKVFIWIALIVIGGLLAYFTLKLLK